MAQISIGEMLDGDGHQGMRTGLCCSFFCHAVRFLAALFQTRLFKVAFCRPCRLPFAYITNGKLLTMRSEKHRTLQKLQSERLPLSNSYRRKVSVFVCS